MKKSLRKSGIDIVGDVPCGTHFCQFYQTKQDLVDTLVPYFKTGLENNEFCLWVTSQPLESQDAKEALKRVIPGFDTYLEKGQIQIIPCNEWYLKEKVFDQDCALSLLAEKFNQELNRNYNGIRFSWNIPWFKDKELNSFTKSTNRINSVINNRMIALFTYSLDSCNAADTIDLALNHQFALIKRAGKWERIEASRRKKAEGAFFRYVKNWEQTFDAVPDLITIIDNQYQIVHANRAMAEKLGIAPEKCIGSTCYLVVHGTNEPPLFCPHKQLLEDGLEHTVEIQENILDGTFSVSVSPLYDPAGKLIGCVHIAHDITERKLIEKSLRESEARYRNIIEIANEGILILDPEFRAIYINKKVEEMLGYSQEEMVGKSGMDFTDEESKAISRLKWENIRQGINESIELRLIRKDGSSIWALINTKSLFDKKGEFTGALLMLTDITKHKKTEEALRLSNLYNRSLIEANLDPLVTIGPDGKITDVNGATEEITGYSRNELIGTDFSDYFTEPQKASAGYRQVFINGEVRDYPLEIRHKDGHITPVLYNASIYKDEEGEVIGVFAAARDITERKKTEDALRESEAKYRHIVETSQEGIWLIDSNDRTVFVNQKISEMLGYSIEELVGQSPRKFMSQEFRAKADNRLHEHMKGISHLIDYHFIRKDSSDFWCILSSSPLFDDRGKYKGSLAMIMDITARKKAEEAIKIAYENLENLVKERTVELEKAYESLKESEEGLAEAQRMAHIGNWNWDLVTDEVDWSNELYRIFGRSPQKSAPTYNELLNYIHPDDRHFVDTTINKGLKESPKKGIDYRIILANGEERVVHSKAEVIFNGQNIPLRVKGVVQDVTESRKSEEKIQMLADAVESSNDAIVTLSLEGIVISWNKGAEQIYGYSAEEIIGKNISITEPDNLKGEIKRFSEKIKQGEKSQRYETSRLRKDGTEINISAILSQVFNASGEFVAILAVARDITERIKTEQTLARIDKLRIKEIHHRIKNNLQVISSLLDLQAEKFQNNEVLEAFRESQNRVISMALIHEELYKGEGTDTLNFSAYLQKLTENLFQTYSLRSKNISLRMDLEDSCFYMDIAVPLGIIVNELVSNSLKHAFSEDEKGEIKIKLCRKEKKNETGECTFNLTISDNGKGIPADLEVRTLESLGLNLVRILVDQLDGEIEIKTGQGTKFSIIFNIAEKQQSRVK